MEEELDNNVPVQDLSEDKNKSIAVVEQQRKARAEKDLRTLAYFSDMDNPEFDDIEKDILKTGLSIPEFKKKWQTSMNAIGFAGDEVVQQFEQLDANYKNIYDFKNSVWDDFATHFQDGLNRVSYGLGVTAPGVVAAFNEDDESPEWVNDWVNGMGEWYDKTKERTSEESNQSFFETGSLRSFAGGMGSGLASMAPMVLNFIPFVGKAAYMATTFSDIFGSVLKNGKENGLSLEDSARMALVLSPAITALEKIGMEGIAEPAKKGIVNKLLGGSMDASIKKMAKNGFSREAFEDTMKVGLNEISKLNFAKKKVGQYAKGFSEGAVAEGVTESLQSILEQTGEQLFDNYFAEQGSEVGKGKYGTDYKSKEFWLQAAEEGFYGALLGGVMSGTGAVSNGLKEQSTYHYVRTSLDNNKPENIKALKNYVSKQQADGKITKDELNSYVATVDQMVDYHQKLWHKLDNPSAKYQSYNNMVIRDKADNISNSDWLSSQEANYPQIKKEIDGLLREIKNDTNNIISAIVTEDANVKVENKDDNKIGYKYKPVLENVIAPKLKDNLKRLNELVPKDLSIDEIYNQQAENEGKLDALKNGKDLSTGKNIKQNFGKVYTPTEGVSITDAAIKDKKGFKELYDKAVEADEKTERPKLIKEIEETYGMDKESANWLSQNIEYVPTAEPKGETKKEVVAEVKSKTEEQKIKLYHGTKKEGQEGVVVSVEKDYKKVLELPEDQLQHLKELSDNGDKKAMEILTSENKYLEADKYIDELYSDKYDAIKYEQKSSKKPVEYYDTKDKKFYSVDEKYAKLAGSLADRSMKYKSLESDAETKTTSTKEQKTTTESKPTEVVKEEVKETVQEVKQKEPLIKKTDENLNKELVNLTDEQIETELESNDKLSTEERKQYSDELAKRNEKAQNNAFLNSLFGSIQNAKEQRNDTIQMNDALLVSSNPELYQKIKQHFAKIFPQIPVTEIDNLGQKYGAQILARLVERGIEIDPNKAIQTSLIHEYAHIYLEILGDNHPLVKLAYGIIEGSQFDEDAKRLYPDKSRAEQLNEALTEAIATDSLEKLQTKFEGSALDKFLAFAKRFWNRISRYFGLSKQQSVVDLLAEQLVLSKKPYKFDMSGLVGINKNQLDKSINPKFVKLKDLIVNNFNHLKLEAIEKGVDYNVRNQDFVSKNAIGALYGLYLKEKSPEYNGTNPLFENVVFDGVVDIKELKELSDVLEVINNFTKQLKEKTPQIYTDTQSLIKELFKISLDFNELTEEDFIEDENQDETDGGKSDANPIKSGKKVSNSVRSILSSILGPDGKRISPDVVFSYVTNIAQKTIGVNGFIKELENEVKRNNPIAHSILSTINGLSEPRRNGLLQTITSLISEKSEGMNVEPTIKDDGTVKWSFKNPLVNKDRELGDVKSNLEKARNIPEIVDYFKLLGVKGSKQDIFNNPADQKALADTLSKLFGIDITIDMLNTIIDNYPPNLKTKLSNKLNFRYALMSEYESILTYLEGQQRNDAKKKVEWKDISGFVERMYNQVADYEALQVNYLNTRGNAESSIKLGHWASDLISMITNKETGRLEAMQNSPIYKNNSVLKYFADKNKVNWAKLDGIKNLVKNETIDYSMTNSNDYHILQAVKFFSSSSTDFYKQSIGVISNRDGMLLFEVPKYSDEKLTKELEKQRESLEQLLKKQMKGLDANGVKKLVNDFNNLYIYKASLDGNVSLPSDTYINKEVYKIESVLKDNGIYDGLNLKEGDLKKYFLTESLNRIYLSDIFSGPALYHSNPKSKKGAVESFIKRMSGLNSNGSNIELKNPITFVVFDGKKEGIDVSDSFSVYSPNLNKEISDFTGSLSPVGLNSKNNIFQIDAATGKNLYVKASTVNSKGDNLKGLGDTYAKIEQALVQIEKHLGNNANVMLIDKSALKGTESFQNITLEELFAASENNKIEDIAYKFSAPIKIESMKTPFNLNKKLKSVDKQSSIFSTQAMQVQFNNNPQAIEKFERIAVKYLVQKMGGVGMQSTVAKWLMNTDNSFNDLLKDMNNRDKSITTEILSAVQEYNKANPNRKITSFDNPSLSKIYEQYVSSKLSKSGIRIEMAGNFLHQLPDIENELAHDEVAVPWAMFANSLEKANELLKNTRATGNELKVAVVRIPASAEVSMFAGKVKYFLDTDANVVKLSNGFVKSSGSDHDGDKAMVYRREMKKDGTFDDFSLKTQMFNEFYNNLSKEQFIKNSTQKDLEFDQLKNWVNQEVDEVIVEVNDKKESKDITKFINHSGGAIGSDTEWDIIGSEFGMVNNKHYWTETKTPKGNTEISKQDFEEGRFESAKAAKRNFGYQYSAMKDSRLIRNWSQVKHSESVFAIGSIVGIGEKLFPKQINDTRIAINPSVTGGTGYAVGMAINNNKPVYVFNQTKGSYDIGWYKYDKNINDFIKVEIPILTQNFAGIGTREINENGKQAIRDVYEKTISKKEEVETSQPSTTIKQDAQEKKETTYKSRSINDVIDIAQKMGFGGEAVGRFAIATKLMSLLGSYNAELNTPIEFRGEKLTNFSNKQLDALALLLQSALDIGNDPVLTETGFTSTTIDVGNAMLLLGVNPETVINLLKSSEIQKLNADYLNKNSVFNLEDKQSFKEFLNKISKDAFGKNLSYEELVNIKGKNVADFLQFQDVANDLSKLISFVQSDKSLPNNAQLNTSVLEGIEEFKKLSFDVSGLMNRELYKHRLDMLNIQSEVYENSLMTSSPMVKSLVKVMSENVTNKFKFQKDVAGQIEHYLAQKQIKTKRINVRDFIYGLSQKMKTIHDAVVLNEPLRFESEIDNDSIINIYKAGLNSQDAYNYALEQLSTYFSKESVAIAEKEVKDYADLMELRKRAEMYKDNSVFDFLRFKEVGNGKVVMSLKPEFKSTDDTKQKFRDDFNKLQELDPQLANEIIEFQLYRYGLNNKIGSFIEGLPMDLNINALALASDLLRSKSARAEIKEELRANLYAKNKSLLPVVKSIQPNSTNKKVVVFEDKIYVRTNEKEAFIKLPIGKFDADENFTAYNVSKVSEASNKIDEEQIKKGC